MYLHHTGEGVHLGKKSECLGKSDTDPTEVVSQRGRIDMDFVQHCAPAASIDEG